jgi:hypothetical protein
MRTACANLALGGSRTSPRLPHAAGLEVDMAGQEDPYSRLYWRVKDDPRFAHAFYCDACWASYTRLLMDAEGIYPASASLPLWLKRHAKTQLVADGIIELRPHDGYVIHGLANERERRSGQARENVGKRWEREYGTPVIQPYSDSNTVAFDPVILAEPSRDEPSQAETDSGPGAYYSVTMRYPQMGSALYDWTTRLGAEYGVEPFRHALASEMRRDHSLRTLLSRTEAALAQAADRAQKSLHEIEADRRAAQTARDYPPDQVWYPPKSEAVAK